MWDVVANKIPELDLEVKRILSQEYQSVVCCGVLRQAYLGSLQGLTSYKTSLNDLAVKAKEVYYVT
ncbi:hypothetical protein [Meiothermus sp.]|uniref:hypothetical protein n=1 Tax=Meiothermus sp. TaxID=1955249 RepID=UPI00345CFFC7